MPSDKEVSNNPKESAKSCPTCGNLITDHSLLRCPRCNGSLIKMGCDGACGKCAMKNNCVS